MGNENWFDEGWEKLFGEMCENTGVEIDHAKEIVAFLSNIGMIDYDIEKDIIYNRYYVEVEDEDDLNG